VPKPCIEYRVQGDSEVSAGEGIAEPGAERGRRDCVDHDQPPRESVRISPHGYITASVRSPALQKAYNCGRELAEHWQSAVRAACLRRCGCGLESYGSLRPWRPVKVLSRCVVVQTPAPSTLWRRVR